MLTAADLQPGDVLSLVDNAPQGNLSWAVVVLRTRACYGREDALIRPENGTGERWVSLERLYR